MTQVVAERAPSEAGARAATLSLRNVTKRFGGVAALDDFSCEVPAGELLGVVGPNGAGKSTLLSLINAAQRPTSGEITLDGAHRIDRMRTHAAARLGIARAHQIPRPFGRMTVRENLLVAAGAGARSPAGSDGVDGILELCGLVDRAARPAGALPLLDLKRLEMARALALQPRLLLLDEVAAGLVAHEIDEITELISSVHRRGVTIILVEHVQALVQALAERVVVLDFGRQIAEGTPREIAEDPEVVRIYLGTGDTGPSTRAPRAESAAPTPLLSTSGLGVNYGKLPALRDVDFKVGEAEIVAVLGANGAGKTSLARALSGLVPAAAGKITFGGEDLTTEPPHRRARKGIAICHEGRRLFAGLRVHENLELATYSGSSSAHQEDLYARVYDLFPLLKARAGAFAGELSGGQQQMVAIARALMSDPRLVIFDELSLGLAPTVIDEIYRAIGQIRSWQISIVLIEQNAYRALAVADRAYVLERGRVSYAGAPEALEDQQALRDAYFGGRPAGDQARMGNN
ncbi:MAG TPA: ATP-binding cassette domain-containing protein [Solirubrobacteraceae bacterium]|nr:ATP-binding cassette domain-containing protein [Solirubrobacteraceae bacterium]